MAKNSELLTRDIKLLALSQRHKETFSQAERLQKVEDELCPHRDTRKREYAKASDRTTQERREVRRIESQIAATPANTFAGLVIKLRIATDGLSPEYPRDLETDELNLMAALADAERLAEGVI